MQLLFAFWDIHIELLGYLHQKRLQLDPRILFEKGKWDQIIQSIVWNEEVGNTLKFGRDK